ncbi:methyltransferase domain-containing protein [Candidatus Parcubacteria bacterium]|nr:MAG: methyltransferase domain-containing protein [Candidatus Parcubacteria bacterium]
MHQIEKNQLLNLPLILNEVAIEKDQRVADFGCGSVGMLVFALAQRVGKGGKVYAVDIRKAAIEAIKKEAKIADLTEVIVPVWSDLEKFGATSIETESLEAGFLVNTLYQSSRRAEMLREVIRMIKRGGKLIVVEWNSAPCPLAPPPQMRVKRESLKNSAPKLGLTFEKEVIGAGEYHYCFIFSKM